MQWRSIPGFSRYEVNEVGAARIAAHAQPLETRSAWLLLKPKQQLKPTSNGRYMWYSMLGDDGVRRQVQAHKIVALAFHGLPPSPKHMALHADDNGHNNSYKNIRWGLPCENNIDFVKNGKFRNQHGTLTFTEDQVVRIRARFASENITITQLARDLGVKYDALRDMLRRRRYGWVP